MKICKICGLEKSFSEYAVYRNYPNRFRKVCKECENKKAREKGQKLREEFIRLNKEQEKIINEFNTLNSSNYILNLLVEGYDVSWSGENIVTFNKSEKTVHIKNVTKDIYNLIFARYCIELEKKLINNNLEKHHKIK